MKRVQLKNGDEFVVAEIDGGAVRFRFFEGEPNSENPFEYAAFSVPLDHLRNVVKAADE